MLASTIAVSNSIPPSSRVYLISTSEIYVHTHSVRATFADSAEQVDTKCTRPFLPLVKGLASRLVSEWFSWFVTHGSNDAPFIYAYKGGETQNCSNKKNLLLVLV